MLSLYGAHKTHTILSMYQDRKAELLVKIERDYQQASKPMTFFTFYFNVLLICLMVFILILVIAYFLPIDTSNGETVSMKELNYEIVEVINYDGITNRRDLYDSNDYYFSANDDGYYDLTQQTASEQQFMLVDRNFFNYTGYDTFYIEYYKVTDASDDMEIHFRYTDTVDCGEVIDSQHMVLYNKTCYLSGDGNKDYGGATQNDMYDYPIQEWDNAHISIYYSMSEWMTYTYKGQNNEPVWSANHPVNDVYYRDVEEEITLPDNEETTFERLEIDIKDQFQYTYPQLHRYMEITLQNLEIGDQLYIKDFGFIMDDSEKMVYEYTKGNYTFMLTYGNAGNLYDLSLSEWDYLTSGYDYTTYFYNSYGDNHQYFFHADTQRQAHNYQDFNLMYLYLYSSQIQIFDDNSIYWASGNDNMILIKDIVPYEIPASYRVINSTNGFQVFQNQYSTAFQFKMFYTTKLAGNIIWNFIGHSSIDYIQPKGYYGFGYNTTLGNVTYSNVLAETKAIIHPIYDQNIIYNSYSISDENTLDYYQISGNWRAFDSIRKGLNIFLEAMQTALGSIYSFLSPLFTTLGSITSAINSIAASVAASLATYFQDVVDAVGDIATDVFALIEPYLEDIFDGITDVANSLSDVYDQIVIILDDLTAVLLSLTDIIGLLTVYAWLVDLITLVSGVILTVIDYVAFLITDIVDYLDMFIDLIGFLITFFSQAVKIYLLVVIAISMSRLVADIPLGMNNTIDITRDFFEWLFLPLKAFLWLIKTIFDAVMAIIPL